MRFFDELFSCLKIRKNERIETKNNIGVVYGAAKNNQLLIRNSFDASSR